MKKSKLFFTITFLLSFALLAPAQERALRKPTVDFTRTTSVGNIAMTITNYGTFGEGFAQQRPVDLPSCEYPKDWGIEHAFDGGIWIGARKDNGSILVSTGAVDASSLNFTVAPGFEFTTSANPSDILLERSSLLDSPFFDPRAISHQDFIADFSDSNLTIPETGDLIPEHTPLKLAVHLETYAWNFPFADAFVIFNYTIRNASLDTLREVYLGVMADLVVRNTRITPHCIGAPLYWDRNAEFSRDLISGEMDFEGYRIYRSQLGADLPGRDLLSSMTLIAEFDSSNGLNYDTGFRARICRASNRAA